MGDKHGEVCWSELICEDTKAARDWYAKTCGWSFDEMPMGEGEPYYIAKLEGEPVCGIMKRGPEMPAEMGSTWMTYLAVDDVDAAARGAAQKLGEPFDVPGVGRIAMVADPAGAVVGLITPAAQE